MICLASLCARLNLFGSHRWNVEETLAEVAKEAVAPSFRIENFATLLSDLLWPFSVPFSAVLLLVLAWFLAFSAERIVAMLLDLTLLIQPAPSSSTSLGKNPVKAGGTLLFGVHQSLHGLSSHAHFTSLLFGMTSSISIAARVYLGMRAFDWLYTRLPVGTIVHFFTSYNATASTTSTSAVFESLTDPFRLSESALTISMIIWVGMSISAVKRFVIFQCFSSKHIGRVTLLDRMLDIVTFFAMALAVLNKLSIDSTIGIQSVLSAGGVGALIFSLASKDLATEIVGGLALNAWNAIDVGDRVRLLDGTTGKVIEIGLVETLIQGFDNVITRIPNSMLTKSRFSNLSRTPRSRLRQYLRFKHSDVDKLPALLEDIKEEMKISCPKLISDGSKSFHAVLTSFEPDHIQGMVLAHFEIQPSTGEFTRNRSVVMFAIARAMKKHGLEFALPTMVYTNTASPSRPPMEYDLGTPSDMS
jgi:small-conductance mechanosensitive channel